MPFTQPPVSVTKKEVAVTPPATPRATTPKATTKVPEYLPPVDECAPNSAEPKCCAQGSKNPACNPVTTRATTTQKPTTR